MKQVDTIIIGGGISGVSFADALNRAGIENIIIEKNKIGGCIDTEQYSDIWFEMGAHTVYNSYADTIKFIKNNNLSNKIISRKKLPFLFVQLNAKVSSVFKNINLISLAISFLKNRKIKKQGKTVSQYASKVFGKANYDKTLKYCFNAVLSQDSANFPMEYLFKKYDRDKSLPRSFTLKNGLSTLFQNIRSEIINEEVQSISKNKDKWLIKTHKNTYLANNICLALPWHITEKLIINILPNIAKHNYRPRMSKLMSIAVIIDKKQLGLKNIAGLIGKQQFFYSAVSRDVVEHDNLRVLTFHCPDDNQNKASLIYQICKLLNIMNKDILHTVIKKNALPCYNENHSIFISDLDREISQVRGLFISGNFFDRLAVENCVKRSYNEADRVV